MPGFYKIAREEGTNENEDEDEWEQEGEEEEDLENDEVVADPPAAPTIEREQAPDTAAHTSGVVLGDDRNGAGQGQQFGESQTESGGNQPDLGAETTVQPVPTVEEVNPAPAPTLLSTSVSQPNETEQPALAKPDAATTSSQPTESSTFEDLSSFVFN